MPGLLCVYVFIRKSSPTNSGSSHILTLLLSGFFFVCFDDLVLSLLQPTQTSRSERDSSNSPAFPSTTEHLSFLKFPPPEQPSTRSSPNITSFYATHSRSKSYQHQPVSSDPDQRHHHQQPRQAAELSTETINDHIGTSDHTRKEVDGQAPTIKVSIGTTKTTTTSTLFLRTKRSFKSLRPRRSTPVVTSAQRSHHPSQHVQQQQQRQRQCDHISPPHVVRARSPTPPPLPALPVFLQSRPPSTNSSHVTNPSTTRPRPISPFVNPHTITTDNNPLADPLNTSSVGSSLAPIVPDEQRAISPPPPPPPRSLSRLSLARLFGGAGIGANTGGGGGTGGGERVIIDRTQDHHVGPYESAAVAAASSSSSSMTGRHRREMTDRLQGPPPGDQDPSGLLLLLGHGGVLRPRESIETSYTRSETPFGSQWTEATLTRDEGDPSSSPPHGMRGYDETPGGLGETMGGGGGGGGVVHGLGNKSSMQKTSATGGGGGGRLASAFRNIGLMGSRKKSRSGATGESPRGGGI